jgi:hypothetical protein
VVEEVVFIPLYVLDAFVKNQMGVVAWIHICVSYTVTLVFVSVFVPVPCSFYCYVSAAQFEIWYCDTSCIASFVQYCLGYLWFFLCFQINSKVSFLISVMIVIVILMGIVFGSIAIFTMLILQIHKHGRPFHLLKSSLISFFVVLKFSF